MEGVYGMNKQELMHDGNIIYIIPTQDKPIKIVIEPNPYTVKIDGDDIVLTRKLDYEEKVEFLKQIQELSLDR